MFIRSGDFEVSIHSLLFQAEYYVFDFNPQKGLTRFLIVREDVQEQVPFVDIRLEPFAQSKFSLPTPELFALEQQHDIVRPPIHYIFHHAFVCSTLLARCLNQIDAFFSLKEPWILRRLSDVKRTATIPEPHWREMFRTYNALLSKNFSSGHATVVKATNVANNLIVDVLKLMPGSRILYLYSDLQSFLVSNLKKTAETQGKMPDLYRGFSRDSDFAKRFAQFADPDRFSLLQVCALIWVANLYSLKRVLERYPDGGVVTLDMQTLLDEPAEYLEKSSIHFGHAPSPHELEQMTHEKIMKHNAKDPRQQYGDETRQQEAAQILDQHRSEIGAVLNWIGPVITDLELEKFMQSRAI